MPAPTLEFSTSQTSSSALLEENLRALARWAPKRATELRDPGPDQSCHRARRNDDGTLAVEHVYRRRWIEIHETQEDLLGDVDIARGHADSEFQLLVGIGCGRRAHRMLGEMRPDEQLVVWEDDPTALQVVLAHVDLRDALETGRLRLATTADLESNPVLRFRRALRAHKLRPFTHSEWIRAQTLLALHREEPAPLPAAACWVRRGELLQRELHDALTALGRTVREVEIEALSDAAFDRALQGAPAGGLWMMNFDPDLVERVARSGCRSVVWEIDPSADAVEPLPLHDPRRDRVVIFTWRQERVARFRRAGYRFVHHLPIGVAPDFRKPIVAPVDREEIVFVGSCMQDRARDFDGVFLEAAARDEARTDAWRSLFEARSLIDHEIVRNPCRRDAESRLEARRQELGLPETIATPHGLAAVGSLLGERLAATKRRTLLEALSDLPLAVHGEENWDGLLPDEVYRGPVGHGEALNRVYTNAGINLDQNRIYQADIATLRVFEASACAGFVLAEWAEDLEPLFDFDREIAVYRTVDELRASAQSLLADRPERRRRAHAARDRVLTDHTVKLRVALMLLTIAETPELRRTAGTP